MIVGDEDEGAILPFFSQLDKLAHSAKVVADMEVASRLHSRDEDRFLISHIGYDTTK